ncbi:unnamed protein product [Adineta ricciae]|uniref:Uncharacterized protein n=1 Tax=Adineta ricciae TaxID=249248 RepID=A0A815QAZ3_ADIRI|nr:unnamed protein product [Adineta ricciae]
MTSVNQVNDSSSTHHNADVKCEQMFSGDQSSEHQEKLQEHFQYVMYTLDSMNKKWQSLSSEISADAILDLINPIYEYSLKLDEIERRANTLQQQFKDLGNSQTANRSKDNQNASLENDVERLKRDIEELQMKLDKISDDIQNQTSTESSVSSDYDLPKEKYPVRLFVNNSKDASVLSQLVIGRSNSSSLSLTKDEAAPVESQNQTSTENVIDEDDDDEDRMVVYLGSDAELQINHEVRFSNNIVRWLRGPFKAMVQGLLKTVDLFAKGTHISEYILDAVRKGLAKQGQNSAVQKTTGHSIKPTFAEITSDWKLEGKNEDEGYSSSSLWIRNPQGERILIKIQELPLCAVNEWLAYVLGKVLGLPVNEVQIAVYENQLATLHSDAEEEGEKTVTFKDLPKKKRDLLLKQPIMEEMDIFDHIIQNVDRNQQNILLTVPKTVDVENDDEQIKAKIHLIDHASSFGMGKVSGVSTMAAKFHSNHLSIVKFDPVQKSKQFEKYLRDLPVEDRPLISKTLERFANITDEQLDSWITEIQALLSPGQYNRIYSALRRQRDVVKRCLSQWGAQVDSNKAEEKVADKK